MTAALTLISSDHVTAAERPVVCAIPGHPDGSLKDIAPLTELFDLALLEVPTGKATGGRDFEKTVEAIEGELLWLRRPIVLAGHSRGEAIAAALACRGNLDLRGIVFHSATLKPGRLHEAVAALKLPKLFVGTKKRRGVETAARLIEKFLQKLTPSSPTGNTTRAPSR